MNEYTQIEIERMQRFADGVDALRRRLSNDAVIGYGLAADYRTVDVDLDAIIPKLPLMTELLADATRPKAVCVPEGLPTAEELSALGLTKAATTLRRKTVLAGYIAVTRESIQKYLCKLAQTYNRERGATGDCIVGLSVAYTVDSHARGRNIGKFEYKEVGLAEYEGVPPRHVLDAIREHKSRNVFDTMVVGSVQFVPDPIVWGMVNGDTNRYFIAQWDKDICLDDVI